LILDDSYTLLGVDFKSLSQDFELKYSYIAYNLIILMTSVSLLFTYFQENGFSLTEKFEVQFSLYYIFSSIVIIPLSAVAMFGFIYLGVKWECKSLVVASLAVLLIGILATILPLVAELIYYFNSERSMNFDILSFLSVSMSNGVTAFLFGTALWKVGKDKFICLTACGNVVFGLLSFLVVMFPIMFEITFVLGLFVMCMESYILCREVTKKT